VSGDEIMIVTTTENIQGYAVETLEIVFGNTVRAKHVGKDIMAGLKSIVGGELHGYSKDACRCKGRRHEQW